MKRHLLISKSWLLCECLCRWVWLVRIKMLFNLYETQWRQCGTLDIQETLSISFNVRRTLQTHMRRTGDNSNASRTDTMWMMFYRWRDVVLNIRECFQLFVHGIYEHKSRNAEHGNHNPISVAATFTSKCFIDDIVFAWLCLKIQASHCRIDILIVRESFMTSDIVLDPSKDPSRTSKFHSMVRRSKVSLAP